MQPRMQLKTSNFWVKPEADITFPIIPNVAGCSAPRPPLGAHAPGPPPVWGLGQSPQQNGKETKPKPDQNGGLIES